MRKATLVAVILFALFGTSKVVVSQETHQEQTTIALLKYQAEKKSPATAVIFSFIVPTLGHAYAGNWPRGFLFFLGWGAATAYAIQTKATTRTQIFFGLAGALRIGEVVDAYRTTNAFNKKLAKKYGFELSVIRGNPALTLTFRF